MSGSHRCGKSTLAKLYAERTGIQFVETETSQIFLDLGFSPKVDYDFKTRLFIQRKVLESMNNVYSKATGVFIADRTPIDALAYTLADITRDNVGGELQSEFKAYSHDCIEVLNRNFNTLMIIQPGIKMVETPGKAPINEAYIEHLNFLIMGIAIAPAVECNHFYIPRDMTDLEDRFLALHNTIERVEERHRVRVEEGSLVIH